MSNTKRTTQLLSAELVSGPKIVIDFTVEAGERATFTIWIKDPRYGKEHLPVVLTESEWRAIVAATGEYRK